MFFEKELLYCKLTGASAIQKGQLLVSFGAVGSWSFGVLKKVFLYQVALHELKMLFFSANQKVFHYRKLYETPAKAAFSRTKFSFAQTFFIATQSIPFPPSISHFNAP